MFLKKRLKVCDLPPENHGLAWQGTKPRPTTPWQTKTKALAHENHNHVYRKEVKSLWPAARKPRPWPWQQRKPHPWPWQGRNHNHVYWKEVKRLWPASRKNHGLAWQETTTLTLAGESHDLAHENHGLPNENHGTLDESHDLPCQVVVMNDFYSSHCPNATIFGTHTTHIIMWFSVKNHIKIWLVAIFS